MTITKQMFVFDCEGGGIFRIFHPNGTHRRGTGHFVFVEQRVPQRQVGVALLNAGFDPAIS